MERDNLPDRIREELLMCRVCYGRFSPENLPKILTCSHTFCQACIRRYTWATEFAENPVSNSFPCPVCRETSTLPPQGVAGLPNNYTVLGLLDIVGSGKEDSVEDNSNKLQPGSKSKTINRLQCAGCGAGRTQITFPCAHRVCKTCMDANRHSRTGELQCPACVSVAKKGVVHLCDMCRCEGKDLLLFPCSHSACSACIAAVPRRDRLRCPACYSSQPSVYDSPKGKISSSSSTPRKPTKTSNIYSSPAQSSLEITKTASSASLPMRSLPPPLPLSHGSGANGKATSSPAGIQLTGKESSPHNLYEVVDTRRWTSSTLASAGSRGDQEYTPPFNPFYCQSAGALPRGNPSPYEPQEKPSVPRRASTSFLYGTLGRRTLSYGNHHHSAPASPHPRSGPPPTPPPRLVNVPLLRCVGRIGKFSDVRMQTGAFCQPAKVDASSTGELLAVTDVRNMTVQILRKTGEYVSMFRVLGVQGVCFLGSDRLAVASHRGVELVRTDGRSLAELNVGQTVSVKPFRFGLVACRPQSLVIFKQSLAIQREITRCSTSKSRVFRKSRHFQSLKDVAVSSQKEIVLLDGGAGEIIILNEDAVVKIVINTEREMCGRLNSPFSLCVDKSDNVIIADTGSQRLLKFAAGSWKYQRTLVDFRQGDMPGVSPYGLTVTDKNEIVLVAAGNQFAEVQIYVML